jgi:hypothetical protein
MYLNLSRVMCHVPHLPLLWKCHCPKRILSFGNSAFRCAWPRGTVRAWVSCLVNNVSVLSTRVSADRPSVISFMEILVSNMMPIQEMFMKSRPTERTIYGPKRSLVVSKAIITLWVVGGWYLQHYQSFISFLLIVFMSKVEMIWLTYWYGELIPKLEKGISIILASAHPRHPSQEAFKRISSVLKNR